MIVEIDSARDPLVALAESFLVAGERALLVAAAPGMGKSSTLASVVTSLSKGTGTWDSIWISGEVIAGEAHLTRLLDLARGNQRTAPASAGTPRRILALDDADEMLSKRSGIALTLQAVVEGGDVQLIGTAHPSAVGRLVSDGPFRGAQVLSISVLNESAARALVMRRAPSLAAALVNPIIQWAGGHPAALVYLSRLAEVSAVPDPQAFLDRAAEFAGAVYAEPWTGIGPQQRAILRQLSAGISGEDSISSLATSLSLSAAHVGAQLGRLVMEGLAHPTGMRGRYGVAPLLACWIARRATRGQTNGEN